MLHTRIGFVEGVCVIGVIDEIRMPEKGSDTDRRPIIVDTKTRVQDSLPAEPQRRNGRYAYFICFYFNVIIMKTCQIMHLNLSDYQIYLFYPFYMLLEPNVPR